MTSHEDCVSIGAWRVNVCRVGAADRRRAPADPARARAGYGNNGYYRGRGYGYGRSSTQYAAGRNR
jgi:hypothetical protein